MKVKKVTLRRIFNLGNYENIQPELEADLDPGDNPQDAMLYLEREINNYVKYTRVGNEIPEKLKNKESVNHKTDDRFKKLEIEGENE